MTMDDKLHLAPLTNPKNVLDIATGTGIWAIEFGDFALAIMLSFRSFVTAQQYPSATVLGTDLSPIQPLL
jgi:ubiquinone/menaquinone biosynthesis C-methylase UbiE